MIIFHDLDGISCDDLYKQRYFHKTVESVCGPEHLCRATIGHSECYFDTRCAYYTGYADYLSYINAIFLNQV